MSDIITVDFKVQLTKLRSFKKAIKDAESNSDSNNPISNAIKQWAVRYRSFLQRRYLKFAKGGGDWTPLKSSTILARIRNQNKGKKKKKKKGKLGFIDRSDVSILIDTSMMVTAFQPIFLGLPGQVEESIPFGIRVGVGGNSEHKKGKVTLGELYNIHHFGLGNVPERKIIVPPDQPLLDRMKNDMLIGIRKLTK